MKKLFCAILLCILCLSLISCGKTEPDYRNDVTLPEFTSSLKATVSDLDLTRAADGFVAVNYSSIDTSLCKEYAIYISQKGSADQFGIFICDSQDNAKIIQTDIEKYLKNLQDNWMGEYLPEDTVKIENATVEVKGCYVLFTVLDSDNSNSVSKAFDEIVKVK